MNNPNAKENTHLVCMVECKDSMENLRTVLAPLKEQFIELKQMKWEGNKMDLWLCGGYDFFT